MISAKFVALAALVLSASALPAHRYGRRYPRQMPSAVEESALPNASSQGSGFPHPPNGARPSDFDCGSFGGSAGSRPTGFMKGPGGSGSGAPPAAPTESEAAGAAKRQIPSNGPGSDRAWPSDAICGSLSGSAGARPTGVRGPGGPGMGASGTPGTAPTVTGPAEASGASESAPAKRQVTTTPAGASGASGTAGLPAQQSNGVPPASSVASAGQGIPTGRPNLPVCGSPEHLASSSFTASMSAISASKSASVGPLVPRVGPSGSASGEVSRPVPSASASATCIPAGPSSTASIKGPGAASGAPSGTPSSGVPAKSPLPRAEHFAVNELD